MGIVPNQFPASYRRKENRHEKIVELDYRGTDGHVSCGMCLQQEYGRHESQVPGMRIRV